MTRFLLCPRVEDKGCRFGTVIFNMLYAKALTEVRERLMQKGIVVRIKLAKGRPPWQSHAGASITDDAPVIDVTFGDNEAIILTASVPVTLRKRLDFAIQTLSGVFAKYMMTVNWKPGKSEAMLVFRCKNARSEKLAKCREDGNKSYVLHRPGEQSIAINVVSQYAHLGSIVADSGKLVPDAVRRASKAMNSFVPLSGTVFSSKGVKLKRKAALGFPLVVSVLTYNVHVWSTFAGAARRHLNHVYMRLWRRICDVPRYGRTRLTDLQVRQYVGAPSIDCYVRKRR